MSETIYIDSDNLVTVDALYDNAAAAYVNDATVTMTLKDRAGTEVSGETWPVTLSYVSGSNGKYQGTLSDTLTLSRGKTYEVTISVNGGAGKALTIKRKLPADYQSWT